MSEVVERLSIMSALLSHAKGVYVLHLLFTSVCAAKHYICNTGPVSGASADKKGS